MMIFKAFLLWRIFLKANLKWFSYFWSIWEWVDSKVFVSFPLWEERKKKENLMLLAVIQRNWQTLNFHACLEDLRAEYFYFHFMFLIFVSRLFERKCCVRILPSPQGTKERKSYKTNEDIISNETSIKMIELEKVKQEYWFLFLVGGRLI